jgi:putative phage-type endonuclease
MTLALVQEPTTYEKNLINYRDRPTWLAARQEGVGASEVAILFGLAPSSWGSAFSLWMEKTGRAPRRDLEGEYLEIGGLIEPVVAGLYEKRTGRKIWDGGPFCVARHPRIPELRATPDRIVIEADGMPGPGNLQIKNAGWYMAHDWADGIPDHVVVQVQTEIACLGVRWGSAAVLVGGNKFKFFDVMRDDALIDEIEAQVAWFWDLVKRNVAPPVDGSEATEKVLKRLHPNDDGSEIALPDDALAWVSAWRSGKDAISATTKENKDRIDTAENLLRAAIGDATFGLLPDGRRLTLKTTTVPEKLAGGYSFRTLKLESQKKGRK